MFISNQKLKFLLTQTVKLIDQSHRYEISNLSFSSSIQFHIQNSSSYTSYDDKVELRMSKSDSNGLSEISDISIKKNNESIDLKALDLSKFKTEVIEIKNKAFEKIKSFEDKKFLKMFPEYDTSLDRDMKLEELLGSIKEEVKDSEDTNQEKEKVEKKKFWGIF